MSEIRKIVVEDFPAADLPDRLRRDFGPDEILQITMVAKPKEDAVPSFIDRVREYHRAHPKQSVTSQEAVARIRALRDEWD